MPISCQEENLELSGEGVQERGRSRDGQGQEARAYAPDLAPQCPEELAEQQ